MFIHRYVMSSSSLTFQFLIDIFTFDLGTELVQDTHIEKYFNQPVLRKMFGFNFKFISLPYKIYIAMKQFQINK